jgi:hypothetical protein
MASKDSVPAAIEGERLQIQGQKITSAGAPLLTRNTNEMVFPVTATRRAKGIITQERNPKEARFRPYSFLDEGDEISGKNLWGFSSLPLRRINVGGSGRTSGHSGQDATLSGSCFLEIVRGWRGLSLSQHPRQELLA